MRDQDKPVNAEILFSERFWRNRKGEAVCVEIKKLDGKSDVIDVRQYFTARDGSLRPTTRGVCLALGKLPDLKRAIDRAMNAANDLGLCSESAKP